MKFEVYYTGGGIWIAEAKEESGRYYTVESSCMGCLSLFNPPPSGDDDDKFMAEDMLWSKEPITLDAYHMSLYLLLCHMIEWARRNF